MSWHRTISVKAIEKAKGASVKIGNDVIFIAKIGASLYAIDGVCSHAKCILGSVEAESRKVKCFCHDAEFDLKDGKMTTPPFVAPNAPMDKLGLRTFPAREENGFIEVDL
ncbi:MAG: Rieske (2Fe-2S) protein [Thermoplasmataceae archaeon]